MIFESNRNDHYQLFRQNLGVEEAEPLVLTTGDSVLAQLSPDGKWILYRRSYLNSDKRLMRVAVKGGTPQPVPLNEKLGEFRCASQAGSRCVLRTVENGQFVFHELDPIRGEGRELARTAWEPAITADWDVSPDGSQVAIPNHDLREAKIRVLALSGSTPGSESTITLNGSRDLNDVVWASDGRGWLVTFRTSKFGALLSYADLHGNTTDLLRWAGSAYVALSPDGRHIAFPQGIESSNVWLFKGL